MLTTPFPAGRPGRIKGEHRAALQRPCTAEPHASAVGGFAEVTGDAAADGVQVSARPHRSSTRAVGFTLDTAPTTRQPTVARGRSHSGGSPGRRRHGDTRAPARSARSARLQPQLRGHGARAETAHGDTGATPQPTASSPAGHDNTRGATPPSTATTTAPRKRREPRQPTAVCAAGAGSARWRSGRGPCALPDGPGQRVPATRRSSAPTRAGGNGRIYGYTPDEALTCTALTTLTASRPTRRAAEAPLGPRPAGCAAGPRPGRAAGRTRGGTRG
jgi:hypothetical protein